MLTLPAAGRHDLADREWSVLEPLLPAGKRPGRPPKHSRRRLIDAIRWRTRTGAPWRDVLPEYGPWPSAYGLFRRWQLDGTWAVIVTALAGTGRCGRARDLVRLGRLGGRAGAPARRRRPQGRGRAEGAARRRACGATRWGRSRGGLTVKFHLACEQGQKPLAIPVTAGQRGDSPQFTAVLDAIRVPRPGGGRPRTRPDRVLADKAYGSRANRAYLRRRGIRATIPEPADRIRNLKGKGSKGGRPPAFDPETYKQRRPARSRWSRSPGSRRSSPSLTRQLPGSGRHWSLCEKRTGLFRRPRLAVTGMPQGDQRPCQA